MMKYIKNVVTLKLDREKCIGCSLCITVCPHKVFEMEPGKVKINDLDSCMECGACARNCPVQALSVVTGVGCASGILNGILNGSGECCCDKGGICA